MANRRMFSLDVIDTDAFLDLPISSQALYFHLGMRADDDGFISSPKRVITIIGSNQDDLKLLIAKGFIIAFENGIVVIRHWKQQNYIQSDRYRKTKYSEERKQLKLVDNVYRLDTEINHIGYNTDTQYRLSKDIVRDSIELGNTICPEPKGLPQDLSGILLPLNDKSFYDVPLEKMVLWKETYPAVDIEQELKRMIAWLDSNPTRRKTRRGITKFINSWLSREQDRGGTYKNTNRQQALPQEEYELSPENQELYKNLGKKMPGPDDPFQ